MISFILVFLALGKLTEASIGNTLPFSGSRPIPASTPEPINIELSQVHNVTTFPLLIFAGLTEKARVNNTGHTIEVTLDQPLTSTVITGGLLYNQIYIYRKCRFYWTRSTKDVAGSTINRGHGTPLEISLLYYNSKYKSFKKALKYRDGLTELLVRVNVFDAPIPNPLFYPFEYYLKSIRKAGTSKKLFIVIAFIWYALVPPTSTYIAYPGSYTDLESGQIYYCTTTIVVPLYPFHFISKKQFEDTFGKLLGYNNQSLSNPAPQAPPDDRPIVQSAGSLAIPTLGGIFPSKEC